MSDKAKTQLLLKRAATSRPSGQWSEEDFDVFNLVTGLLPCEVACNAHLYTFPNFL
jgi:hypothetical protein